MRKMKKTSNLLPGDLIYDNYHFPTLLIVSVNINNLYPNYYDVICLYENTLKTYFLGRSRDWTVLEP
jgi:hypothetical protein